MPLLKHALRLFPALTLAFCTYFSAVSSYAQVTLSTGASKGAYTKKEEKKVSIRELNWLNQQRLESQREIADQLVREKLGRQLRQTRLDLGLLQRILEEKHVRHNDNDTLQALGVALGDIFAAEHKKLNWVVYTDRIAPSHAICLEDTTHCLFPITMISRRVRAGLVPDVEKMYLEALSEIKKFIPKLPYTREQ